MVTPSAEFETYLSTQNLQRNRTSQMITAYMDHVFGQKPALGPFVTYDYGEIQDKIRSSKLWKMRSSKFVFHPINDSSEGKSLERVTVTSLRHNPEGGCYVPLVDVNVLLSTGVAGSFVMKADSKDVRESFQLYAMSNKVDGQFTVRLSNESCN
jgi:hypothetical protein